MSRPIFEIRPYDESPTGIEQLAELLTETFPKDRRFGTAYLEWTYHGSPEGRAIGFNAYAGDRLVAHFAITPMRARIDGAEELGVQLQHAATRPEYRRMQLFRRLVEHALAAGAEAGYGFAVAAANADSTLPFVDRLGFQFVRPLDVRLGIGPTPSRRPGLPGGIQFERIWDATSLAWRLSRPELPYRVRRDGERARVYTGLFGIQVELGTFLERDVSDSIPPVEFRHPVRAWIGLDPERHWRGRAYVNVPARLRPAPLNFIFRDLTDRRRRLDADRIRVDMLDYDQF